MLANAEMKIPAAVVIALEIAGSLERQPGLRRGREVGGTAEQPRQARGDRVQHMSRRVAAGDALRVGRKRRNVSVPPLREVAPLHPLALISELRISVAVALEERQPFRPQLLPAGTEIFREMLVDAFRHEKLRVLRPVIKALGQLDLGFAQRLAMSARGILLMRRTVADMAFDNDQTGPIVDPLGDSDRFGDALAVVGVADPLHMPAIGEKPPGDILAERESGVAFDRDVVAVVDPAEIAEPQMAGHRSRLAADAFHHAAVTAQREDIVIEQPKILSVEVARQPVGRDRHPDAGRNPLPQRAGRRLDTGGPMIFRVTRALAVELAEPLQIVERDGRRAEPLGFFVNRFYS